MLLFLVLIGWVAVVTLCTAVCRTAAWGDETSAWGDETSAWGDETSAWGDETSARSLLGHSPGDGARWTS
jgi:hypothetical protein